MEIRQFKLSEKAALLSFLKIAYADSPRQHDRRFWEWHFEESPYAELDNMPVWIAAEGDEIVGQLAAIPVELKVADKTKPAIWILDFIVREDFRGKGIGKKLILASQEFCPLGLGVNTMEQHAPIMLQKLGWKIVSKISRYNKLLFPGEALREITKIKPLRQLVNIGFAPLRPRFSPNLWQEKTGIRIVGDFDSSFDKLWEKAARQWTCGVVRSSKILNWQYRLQPGKKFDVLGYYENENLLGYVVLYFRQKDSRGALAKAAITDICYDAENSSKIIDALLRGALQLAVERRTGALVTDIIDPLIQERLKKFGFWQTKNPLQLMVKSDEYGDVLYQPENWFLTRGDADISIFEHPNLETEN